MGRLVAHLVHGTWPRRILNLPRFRRSRSPLWFEDGSDFQKAIADRLGGEVEFVAFLWSGRNSVQARLKAATGLADQISETAASKPGARQVVIAHSHGGNVAARALALLDPGSRPVGVATLATPFLHIRERALNKVDHMYMILAAALGLVVYFVVSPDHLPIWLYSTSNPVVWIPQLAYGLAFALTAASSMAPVLWSSWRDTPRRWQSPNLPDDLNLLILRASGDEASLALAFAGFFTLVNQFFWAVLSFPTRLQVHHWKNEKDSVLSWLDYIKHLRIHYLIRILIACLASYLVFCWRLLPYMAFTLLWCTLMLFTVPWLWAMSSVLLMPFGFEFVALGPTVEVSAESAPEGRWSIEILPPADTALARPIGRHEIHAHPAARTRVAAWLDSILAQDAARA